MASGCEHAQSELMCIANKKKVCKYPSNVVLIVLLFQENKSFGAITICIHPLMYVKPCREQYIIHMIYIIYIIHIILYLSTRDDRVNCKKQSPPFGPAVRSYKKEVE
jgi:hypothetical protein